MRYLMSAMCAVFFYGQLAQSHPVSFQGATSLMSYNKQEENELALHYSLRYWASVGVNTYKISNQEFSFSRANFLLKRWNNIDSQANVYLGLGHGIQKKSDEVAQRSMGSIEADWESRKLYISGMHTQFSHDAYEMSRLRMGIAPYLADYNDLNTWFIVQFDKVKSDDNIQSTQFVRLFYRNILIELGAVYGGGYAFNFMGHF